MPYLKIDIGFLREIQENQYFNKLAIEFINACNNQMGNEFLTENPDFLQMMFHLNRDKRMEIVDD